MKSERADKRSDPVRGIGIGAIAGLVGMLCCVSPVVMVLLGLSTVSFAISLANTLYYQYGWYFRGAALLMATAGMVWHLRRQRACSVEGLRASWKMLAAVVVSMVAVYVGLYYVTTWLGRTFG